MHNRPPNLGCTVRHGSRPLPSHLRQSKLKTCRCQYHSTIGTAGLHLWSKFSPHKQIHRVTYRGSVCQMYHRVTELLIGPKYAVMSLPRPRINSPGLDSDTSHGGLDYSRGWVGERMRKHPNLQLGAHSPPSLPTPQGLTTRFQVNLASCLPPLSHDLQSQYSGQAHFPASMFFSLEVRPSLFPFSRAQRSELTPKHDAEK